MIGIGVIGYGYWGPNLVRNFMEGPEGRVVLVSDLSPERLSLAKARYPGIRITTAYRDLIADPEVDAVAIATPVASHFDLALETIKSGKHVLLEKPMTQTSDQGQRLLEEAQRRGLVLMVDHTFVYMGAVGKIKELVHKGELGDIYYYDSTRVNLGLFHYDVNVIWDLAVHDLSIMDFILDTKPRAVSATGISHVSNTPQNVAYVTLYFDSALIAHINVNWLSPVKLRQTLIGGSRKMIVFNDLEPSEKIKVYDTGITVNNSLENTYEIMVGYRTGDMWAPKCDNTEALQVECRHFIDCIKNNKSPITDGQVGLRVVKIMEAANESMARQGTPVNLIV